MPRHVGKSEEQRHEVDTVEPPRAQEGETVLVVDDEPTIRMLIGDTLAELGYQAIEVADAASGLKVLESDVNIDLLITDVGLPGGMNGKEMADAARAKRPKLKVLFITGYAENAAITNGHLEPGMDVMSKPFSMDKLAARIRSIIEAT
jgi:DNA-binding response OmpR family regulator